MQEESKEKSKDASFESLRAMEKRNVLGNHR